MLACWRMGAVALPCNTQLRRHDLEHRVAAASPALAVGEEALLAELPAGVEAMTLGEVAGALDEDRPQETPAEAAEMSPEDSALIVFTSGTTGGPRGVVHSYRYLYGNSAQAEHWFGSRSGEIAWCTTATGWSKSARNVFLAPWLTGATAVIQDGRFDSGERLDLVEQMGVNVLCQAPTEYRMLAKRTELRPLPALRRMVSAGEPLNPEVIARLPRGHGHRDRRRLRPDRDRPGDRKPGRGAGAARTRWAGPCRASRPAWSRASCSFEPPPARPSSPATSTARASTASGGRPGDLVRADRGRLPLLRGPRRRHHPLLRLPDRALRGRVRPPYPPLGRRGCGGRRARSRARLGRPRGRRAARRGAIGASWPASSRSTANARRPPTSSPASSSSPTSCRRPRAGRSSGHS